MNRYKRNVVLVITILLVLILNLGNASAQGPDTPNGLTTPEELEAFIDGLVAAEMDAYHVAGMTVSVVKDGELFFAKGYGYADLERRIPVDAAETLFRPGSISKLFTWTAVMQLVEQGLLDLDEDVETYLDFNLAGAYAQPVTLRHLLTHTPGFEDQGLGLFSAAEEQMVPLGEFLARNVPARVYPPGEISAYSNYGASLAGYIVEQVSGVPFHQYVEENIFEPLEMERSTFVQPLPQALAGGMSEGYLYRQGKYQEGVFEFLSSYPAGGMSTTAVDMAPFMIAHLQGGRYEDGRILDDETAEAMHSLQFTYDPRLDGWGLGFSVSRYDELEVIGHGGDTVYFHSEMLLIPEFNVGLFVSTNTDGGTFARFNFIQAFLERYFLTEIHAQPARPQGFSERASLYVGTYYPARMNYSTFEKILSLLQPLVISTAEDDLLVVSGFLGPDPTYWVEREPDLFVPASESVPASARLVFQPEEDGEGEIRYAFIGANTYIKQPWYGSQAFQYFLLGTSLLFFAGTLVSVPVGGLIFRRYRRMAPQRIPPMPLGARLARWAAWIFAFLNLAFLIALVVITGDITRVIFGLPASLEVLFTIPWVSAVLVAALGVFATAAWMRGWWTVGGRVFYSLLTVVGLGYIWFLWYWNFLG